MVFCGDRKSKSKDVQDERYFAVKEVKKQRCSGEMVFCGDESSKNQYVQNKQCFTVTAG